MPGFLSMDMAEVERILNLEFAEAEESQAVAEEALDDLKRDIRLHADAARNKNRGKTGRAIFVGIILVAAIAVGVWFLPSILPKTSPPTASVSSIAETSSSVSSPTGESSVNGETGLDADATEVPSGNDNPVEVDDDGEAMDKAVSPQRAEQPYESKNSSLADENVVVPPAPVLSASPEAQAPSSERNNVVIIAREKCWLTGTADDATTREVFLLPGDKVTLDFKKRMVVKLGNGGGVDVLYNGKQVDTGVVSGAVKTLVFP